MASDVPPYNFVFVTPETVVLDDMKSLLSSMKGKDTFKNENFQSWLNGKALVTCATVVFGMGIDKPDVQLVIHLSLPPSLECYAQEFGRAGRDGKEASSIVFSCFEDRTRHLKIISELTDGDHDH
ncbi:Bloom syndrome isoform X2 [Paramuricea clavata]|uniref:DNA 3'-5' helicase n=1 Tax=Paramuricea clavata TaxID=317549 RepID=A0A6S7H8U7_PARCT|nr:Bloom syndrome isoform X2 [Paramuricea clavata]